MFDRFPFDDFKSHSRYPEMLSPIVARLHDYLISDNRDTADFDWDAVMVEAQNSSTARAWIELEHDVSTGSPSCLKNSV